MKVEPVRDVDGNLGFELIPENITEKNLLTEFETTTVSATKEESDNLTIKLIIIGQ